MPVKKQVSNTTAAVKTRETVKKKTASGSVSAERSTTKPKSGAREVKSKTSTRVGKSKSDPAGKALNDAAPMREKLILAALNEIQSTGLARFSLRRMAENCGMSCAAPYKHFRNKHEVIIAILRHINNDWLRRQDMVLQKFASESLRVRLVELALEYVRFMHENPQYRSILMIRDDTFDSCYLPVKAHISAKSKELIKEYCEEVGMSEHTARSKMYVVRSLIYGASLMFGNHELKYDDFTMRFVRAAIDREFELPAFISETNLEPDIPQDDR